MRSVPVARSGSRPGPHEFRVQFTRRLRGVRILNAAEAAPPPAPVPPPVAAPVPPPVAAPAPPPAAAPVPPPAPVAAAPSGFVQPDAVNELRADRERIEAVLTSVASAVEGIRTERGERLREWQRAAIELALTIATRILHERIESDALPIENKVRDMIQQLGDDAAVTVRLNPTDLSLLNGRRGGQPLSDEYADPRFVADPALKRGDCQVEGRESMLLSDVTRELEEIREELLRSLKNARS